MLSVLSACYPRYPPAIPRYCALSTGYPRAIRALPPLTQCPQPPPFYMWWRGFQRPEVRGDGSQDPSEAREGGSDWAIVGDIPGHPLNPFKWYRLLMSFYPDGREREAPMFKARDRARPYIYSAGLADLKMLIGRFQSDVDFGVHGLRVGGSRLS